MEVCVRYLEQNPAVRHVIGELIRQEEQRAKEEEDHKKRQQQQPRNTVMQHWMWTDLILLALL
jgi:SET domain-containing protein